MTQQTNVSENEASRTPSGFNPLPYLILMIALGGLAYALLGYLNLQEAHIPESWPTVKGQVVNHGIKVLEHEKADGTKFETYLPKITYRYEVDGEYLLGNQLSLHPSERTIREVAETEISDLPIGTNVTVFYDPTDPKRAVLRNSDTVGAYQAISAGLSIGLVCLALFFISWHRQRNHR